MGYRKSWEAKYLQKPLAGGLPRAAHLGTPKSPLELHEQIALATWLDTVPRLLWCHVPNGKAAAGRATAGLFKAQGQKRGVPDNLIFSSPPAWDRDPTATSGVTLMRFVPPIAVRAVGVAIELKREDATPSLVSPEQVAWGEELASRGWYWFVARGAREAINELIRLGYRGF
jgi:hypothetical protein